MDKYLHSNIKVIHSRVDLESDYAKEAVQTSENNVPKNCFAYSALDREVYIALENKCHSLELWIDGNALNCLKQFPGDILLSCINWIFRNTSEVDLWVMTRFDEYATDLKKMGFTRLESRSDQEQWYVINRETWMIGRRKREQET